ncbi:hypothetical protein GCM10010995_19550 [Cysteiniphilum litorale]|uniref:Uncharacterized protein n=1 Tax=Cysteiniphilum litorale TaxID=2056700 RepID=A0A8J2Z5H0_9GAMM|nr:hypothetical protein GCM10010995_19550 [Cysteiniphilum litorale]
MRADGLGKLELANPITMSNAIDFISKFIIYSFISEKHTIESRKESIIYQLFIIPYS